MTKDVSHLPMNQQTVYWAVLELTDTTGRTLVPLDTVAGYLQIGQDELVDRLGPALLGTLLNYREDQPNSPGWLTLDQTTS